MFAFDRPYIFSDASGMAIAAAYRAFFLESIYFFL